MGCSCTKENIVIENKKFFILSRIAQGGFGTIDLVEESKTSQVYALKRIKCEFKKEIEKASLENKYYKQLNNNQNIIKLIYQDIIEDKKTKGFFILSVFPFYRNGNLQEELDFNIKKCLYIKPDRLLKLFKAICNGLNYIHESNLAHRDLKPLNVLISDDKQNLVLTDFGSMTDKNIEISNSKIAQEIEDWSAQNCSMFYKAPELFTIKTGTVINEKADIWSLGCILYALMFNKGPFDYVIEKGDSIALAVANEKYFIPKTCDRDQKLLSILKKTILFEPRERESCDKILNSLDEIQILYDSKEPEVV